MTLTDDDPGPTLSVADASTTEGNTLGGVLTFTVSLSTASGKTVSVTYGSANGSAIGGSDFVITSGSLEFQPGEQSKPVVVVLHPDLADEPYEHLYLQLTSPVNATLGDAQARGTIVDDDGPANTDFNGDGWPDLVWRNLASSSGQHPEDHQNRIWLMSDRTLEASVAIDPAFDQLWQIRGVADMNSDAKPDLVWQHAGNGQLAAWLYDGTTRIGTPSIATEPDLAWRVMAAADLNNDGHADLVWQNVATGALRVWHMNALVKVDSVPLALNVGTSGWELAGVGDMDGDGHRDLVWRNYSTGGNAAWLMADTTVLQTLNVFPSPTTPADWRIVAVADMNRDGQTDLVWQHITDGRLAIWYMSGLTMVASDYLVNSPLPAADRPYWRIVGGK